MIFAGLGLALAFQASGMRWRRGARRDRGAVPRLQPRDVQEPVVLRRRRGAQRDRRARHREARRPDPPHAAHRVRVPRRLRGDLGAAAAQRLRLRMADLPGDPAEPGTAAMGIEVHSCRRPARCWRCRPRSRRRASSARSASTFLGRPRTPAAAARAGGRPLLARGDVVLAALCLAAGILPGLVIDALAPVVQGLVGARMPVHRRRRGSRSCRWSRAAAPTTGCSSSCSSPRRRRSPPGDPSRRLRRGAPRAALGLRLSRSEPGDAIFRRQLRPADPPRVRTLCSARARRSRCRRRAMPRPARLTCSVHDLIYDGLYAPVARGVAFAAERLNALQFLTIRQLSQPGVLRARLAAPVLALWP